MSDTERAVEALPPLCTSDDLAALGVTGDPAQLDRLIAAASSAARAWCGWSISAQVAVDMPGRHGGKVVVLPTLWLTAVHSVTVDGTLVDVPPWLGSGVLGMPTSCYAAVVANVDHGYDPIPADVSLAVAGMVGRATSAPVGVAGERLGAWSVQYRDAAVAVDHASQAALTPYRLPAVP